MSKGLHAHWSVRVAFNANGGSIHTRDMRVTIDSVYPELPTPIRLGYIFDGWYTDRDGGEKIISGTSVCPRGEHTLYARWAINDNVVVVTFQANGGTVDPSNRELVKGTTYGGLPLPTRNGYSFVGWYTAADGGEYITSKTVVGIEEEQLHSQTLYAHWSANTYLVKFDVNGGQTQDYDKIVVCDTSFGELPIPLRKGYSFDGWYTAAVGGRKVSNNTIATFGLLSGTLYAHWTANSYTISFHSNCSTANPDSIIVTYGFKYGSLPLVKQKGFVFNGWYTAPVGGEQVTEDSVVSITENQELYAHWTAAHISAAIAEQEETFTIVWLNSIVLIFRQDRKILSVFYVIRVVIERYFLPAPNTDKNRQETVIMPQYYLM